MREDYSAIRRNKAAICSNMEDLEGITLGEIYHIEKGEYLRISLTCEI